MIVVYVPLEVAPNQFLLVSEEDYLVIEQDTEICTVNPLILNEKYFLTLQDNYYLAIRNCTPINTIVCLGITQNNTPFFYTFDLFKKAKNALFFLEGLNLDGSSLVNFEIKTIHQLPEIQNLQPTNFLYYFHNNLFYKISFENFAKQFSSFTNCGELIGNTPIVTSDFHFSITKTSFNKILISLNPFFVNKINALQNQIQFLEQKITKLLNKFS